MEARNLTCRSQEPCDDQTRGPGLCPPPSPPPPLARSCPYEPPIPDEHLVCRLLLGQWCLDCRRRCCCCPSCRCRSCGRHSCDETFVRAIALAPYEEGTLRVWHDGRGRLSRDDVVTCSSTGTAIETVSETVTSRRVVVVAIWKATGVTVDDCAFSCLASGSATSIAIVSARGSENENAFDCLIRSSTDSSFCSPCSHSWFLMAVEEVETASIPDLETESQAARVSIGHGRRIAVCIFRDCRLVCGPSSHGHGVDDHLPPNLAPGGPIIWAFAGRADSKPSPWSDRKEHSCPRRASVLALLGPSSLHFLPHSLHVPQKQCAN